MRVSQEEFLVEGDEEEVLVVEEEAEAGSLLLLVSEVAAVLGCDVSVLGGCLFEEEEVVVVVFVTDSSWVVLVVFLVLLLLLRGVSNAKAAVKESKSATLLDVDFWMEALLLDWCCCWTFSRRCSRRRSTKAT